MRLRSVGLLAALLAIGVAGTARGQDFDPRGRHHHPPPRPATHAPAKPGAAAPAAPREGATNGALIERYTRIVLARPGDPFPLQRLAQLYRDRDGSVQKLVADLKHRAAALAEDRYAATIALAGVQKLDGHPDDAVRSYEEAIPLKPADPSAHLALARLLQDRGDAVRARQEYLDAYGRQTAAADKEQTLRALMTLALDAHDYDAAKSVHAKLVALQPSSLFVRGELARELFNRGEFEKAEAEFRDLVQAAQGDNRALAPALKDLGKTLAKEQKYAEARDVLKRAIAVAGAEAGARAEMYQAITETYRAEQRLPEWVAELEAMHPSDFARLALLGSLYEETGDAAKAMETYKRALAVSPRQIDLRLKMIRLLQSQGELDRAIAEYDGLIRAAPNNPQFVFEECDALLQRGDRARALKLLTELEARAGGDEDVLARVADFYQRIGEGERSTKVLARLATSNTNDPSHLVDLGDRYFQDGNQQLAKQTWLRILTTVQPRARALSVLADVYLEHDWSADAIDYLRQAVQLDPGNVGFQKQLAGAFERVRNYGEASQRWKALHEKAMQTGDKNLARESRAHLVTLWSVQHPPALQAQVDGLEAAFNGGDVESGRLLAEVLMHLREVDRAEGVLRKIVAAAPGDVDSYLALGRVLQQKGKLPEAIAVLGKLASVDPNRARELYQQMAQLATDIHEDAKAIEYAEKASALNPEDADGHYKLGKLYALQQRTDDAIREFKAAISKNDRLFPVYFELAELLMARGQDDEADTYYRRVIRGAPDEELVAQAARISTQINLEKGTLESLEQELLPLAIGNPQRPVYRRKLVELYDNLTMGLVQRIKHAGTAPQDMRDADDARAALARIGARAVKPLLDALADADASQQRIAIEVLTNVKNKNAGAALFAFATSEADTTLRVRAMSACGALRDPALLPKYTALLGRDEDVPSDGVAVAAAWGLARMEDRRALPLLRKLAKRGTPDVRAFAILGVGALKDRASARDVAAIAEQQGMGNVARAAAAYVLGGIGDERDRATLITLAGGKDPLSRQMAIIGLARMPPAGDPNEEHGTITAIADALFDEDTTSPRLQEEMARVRRAAEAALVAVATKGHGWERDPLAAIDDRVDAEATLASVIPRDFTAEQRAAVLLDENLRTAVERAAETALTTTRGGSVVVNALREGDGAFEPFVGPPASDATVPAAAHAQARAIASELEPHLVNLPLSHEGGPALVALLARSPRPEAQEKVIDALSSGDEAVQQAALNAIGGHPDKTAVIEVGKLLAVGDKASERWAIRQGAVQAMGRLGAAGARAEATAALRRSALGDPYALVREAALRALASFDPEAARGLAREILAGREPEPRVKDAARSIASSQ